MNSILPDFEIKRLCNQDPPMIHPFVPSQVKHGVISYGLGSFGYDLSLADEFKIFRPKRGELPFLDPKEFNPEYFDDYTGAHCFIPGNSFILGRTVERICMPDDVMGICLGKSTYARCAVFPNITPIEAAWRGYITVEIANLCPVPVKVYAGEGVAQMLFFRGPRPGITYDEKGGNYQDQGGITGARVSR